MPFRPLYNFIHVFLPPIQLFSRSHPLWRLFSPELPLKASQQHASISIYIKLVLLFRSIPIESFLFLCSVLGMQREQSKVPELISACLQRRLNSSWIGNGRSVAAGVVCLHGLSQVYTILLGISISVAEASGWKGICLVCFVKGPIYKPLIQWIWLGTTDRWNLLSGDCENFSLFIQTITLALLFLQQSLFYIPTVSAKTRNWN